MSLLVIDDAAKAAIKAVIDYAQLHHYDNAMRERGLAPGNDERFVARISNYRAVFTLTEAGEKLFRHLSVSVGDRQRLPHPIACCMLASEFGFIGWSEKKYRDIPQDWIVDTIEPGAITIVQEAMGVQ